MNESQLRLFDFLKKQKLIRKYLRDFRELEKAKNKEQMRLLLEEARREGLDLEVEVSEDEQEQSSSSESFDSNME